MKNLRSENILRILRISQKWQKLNNYSNPYHKWFWRYFLQKNYPKFAQNDDIGDKKKVENYIYVKF